MKKDRTFGWIQNPSDFSKLKKTVEVFDVNSAHYQNLRDSVISEIIYFDEDRDHLQALLDKGISEFAYEELVGTSRNKEGKSPKKRSEAVADSLLQITIKPQSRTKKFTDNWTADGFLRWAVSLNFVSYNRTNDSFKITELGQRLCDTEDDSEEEKQVLREAMLAYPPATRVLSLLANSDRPLTKFAIGNQLGFVGEKGFTSYDEELMIDWLKSASKQERKKIKSDIEGTSDKYARMISGWLVKLNFIKKSTPKVVTNSAEKISGFQTYSITGQGLHAIKQATGSSKNRTKPKFLMWEFLAVGSQQNSEQTRNYIRTRRARILKGLQRFHTVKSLQDALVNIGMDIETETLISDIKKLISFGIRINVKGNSVQLQDSFNDFEIPEQTFTPDEVDISSEKRKNYYRKITDLPEKYIELLDIAFDNKRNRDFEIITAGLFREGYGLSSIHLGGQNKPDGVVYNKDHYGIILDTKAYSKGYGKHIGQIDEMVRYIQDNQERDEVRNPNKWWENFDQDISRDNFYYLWVSGKFLPNFTEQLHQTHYRSGINGGGLEVEQLLLGADAVMKKKLAVEDLPTYMNNQVIKFA